MGIFDFFKSGPTKSDNKAPSINLSDFKFLSDDHKRFQNGIASNKNNKGAWRGIRVTSSDNIVFFVTMYNMNGNHPVWGDNIQMAEKPMKLIHETKDKITLRGFGVDMTGTPFSDYGLTLHKSEKEIHRVTLHMHDRKVDIQYEKADNRQQAEALVELSEFDQFKQFFLKWHNSMSMITKVQIAAMSDAENNQGAYAFNEGNIEKAIGHFERALAMMPINDDALKNLHLCYSKTGQFQKAREVEKKLNFLS